MAEHTPNRVITTLLALFLGLMSLAAITIWGMVLILGEGMAGLMGGLGLSLIAVFVALHIPAAIVGVLLWHWVRHDISLANRVLLAGATLYFVAAIGIGAFSPVIASEGVAQIGQGPMDVARRLA
jgi:hypothetical protein